MAGGASGYIHPSAWPKISGFSPVIVVQPDTKALQNSLADCLLADRQRLRRQIQAIQRRVDERQPVDQLAARVEADIARSQAVVAARSASAVVPEFPPELPISERREEIARLIRDDQVVILCGETGSGKSTQLPKICLDLGRGIFGRIGHTQPRRIAARSLADRVSSELGAELGSTVGFKVRFKDHVRPETRVKLMTDGILLAEIQRDRYLDEYDTLIIDEAHERSLNIDFLLGYLRQLLPKRPDLKIVITSATIDPQRFSRHFADAPIIEVSGRTWPVELRYLPPEEEGANERDDPLQQAIVDAVDELSRIDRGDILVFLSGEREIRETAETLRKHRLQLTEILPLYARLGPAEQTRIFKPSGKRRIILATNVAETSLTVPGIRYVIDTGFARISRYSHRSKVQRLPVERVSKASADQRKGRCGRVAEGVCIRLYGEEDFDSRADFTEPEILRTNLASVILQMKVLGFGDIERFPFVDQPDPRLIKDGYRVLEEIGAVDGLRKVTRLGRKLARLPVDPRIGRMLLEAAHTHCLREVLVIAAALSVQDPRDRPMDKQQAADTAHAVFKNEESDFLGYLAMWRHLEEQRRHLTRRKFQALCRSLFLSWTRVQEWHDIHQQLRLQLHEMGYKENDAEAGPEEIHKSVLAGLLSHIGFKSAGKDRDYLGARGSRFFVFPGSGLFEKQPKWVVAAELVETTKLYARTVAGVQPEWIESLAGHLVRRSYSEPHWQKKRGQVGGYEKVTLFGLTLVARRRINFGPINPEESREIFLRSALVDRDFDTRAPFWRHNCELIDHVHHLEAKSRSRDILVDEEQIMQFYAERIPEGIYSTAQFEKWLREASRERPKLLHMRMEDILRKSAAEVTETLYPDALDVGGMKLPLEYRFEPGGEVDGVTLVVPVEVLGQVTEAQAEWLVPGLLRERVIMLMKGLPKQLRRQFVPVPDYADRCLKELRPSDKSLMQALGECLKRHTGVHVPEDAWPAEALPEFLRMRFRVLDAEGDVIDSGRDLAGLKKKHAGEAGAKRQRLPSTGLEREGITGWDFGVLPETVSIERAGIRLQGFPALVDCGDSVAVRVLDSEDNARRAHREGLRRLIALTIPKEIRYLRKNLTGLERMRLQYAKVPRGEWDRSRPGDSAPGSARKGGVDEELVHLILDLTFLEDRPEIRDRETFDQRVATGRPELMVVAKRAAERVAEILAAYQKVRKALSGTTAVNWLPSVRDMQQQLDMLVFQGFLEEVPWAHLEHYPRYLNGLELRIGKLRHAAARDQQWLREMQGLYDDWHTRYQAAREKGGADPRLEEIRWMFEELRVSFFAQELKTAFPISLKRIRKRWEALGL